MMRLRFEFRKHTKNQTGHVYIVRCELENAGEPHEGTRDSYFSPAFEIEVTKEQWDRFLPDSCIEFEDVVKA